MNFIKTHIQSNIATIIIDRENSLNALNSDVIMELNQSFISCMKDTKVGVIILTGHGDKAFIAGADIKSMSLMKSSDALNFSRLGQELTCNIEESPKPVIAAVNGYALGGGCEVSLACHIRIASDNAKFSQPEVHLGLIPGWGGTQRLPRLVGKGKAIEIITSGEMISADEALRIGLVNHVVPPAELLNRSNQIARAIIKNGPKAIRASLECINKGMEMSLTDGLDLEVQLFSKLFNEEETTEGFAAFADKRKPKFR